MPFAKAATLPSVKCNKACGSLVPIPTLPFFKIVSAFDLALTPLPTSNSGSGATQVVGFPPPILYCPIESELELAEPEMLYIVLDRGVTTTIDNSLLVFAEPGNIDVQTDLQHFYASSKVTGSKNHDLYTDYQKMSSKYKDQLHDLLQVDMNNFKDGKETNSPEMIEKRNTILKKKYLAAINFAINHKDYEIAPFIALSEISDAGIKYLDTINKSLTPKVASSKYGKMLSDYIELRKEDEAVIAK